IEIRRAGLELGKILDRTQAAFRAVDLLVVNAAQAHRIEPEAALLGANVGAEVKLAGRVAVDVAIEAGPSPARFGALAIVGRVEFLLSERRQQQPQPVELD